VLGLELLLLIGEDFFVELKLTVDELQELRSREQHGIIESSWHVMSAPVL
jgi:hypothetical protein